METPTFRTQKFHFSRKLILVVTGFLLGASGLVVLTNFSINLMAGFNDFTTLLNRQNQIHHQYIMHFTTEQPTLNSKPKKAFESLNRRHKRTRMAIESLLLDGNPRRIIKNQESLQINFTELSSLIFVFQKLSDRSFIKDIHQKWTTLQSISQKQQKFIQKVFDADSQKIPRSETLTPQQRVRLAEIEDRWQASHQQLMSSVNRASLKIKHFGLWTSVILGILLVLVGVIVTVRAHKSIGKWEESVREKELLLSEIHHRVKNNLAVISGLLELEEMRNGNPQKALADSRDRIQSMAMIHEILYNTDSFSDIDMQEYGDKLLQHIQNSYLDRKQSIQINSNFQPLQLNINQAVPLGLILSELLTNTIQHAFPDSNGGQIDITLTEHNYQVHLQVSDNGKGLPEEFDFDASDISGLSIIDALIEQLDGDVSLEDNNGATFNLRFTKSDSSGSASNHL